MRNIFKKFGREGKNPGGVASTPPLGVFGWRNTLGVCGLILSHYSHNCDQTQIIFVENYFVVC